MAKIVYLGFIASYTNRVALVTALAETAVIVDVIVDVIIDAELT